MLTAAAQAQREFRVFPSFEGASAEAPLPTDWNVPGELTIGRLMYPGGGFRGDWRQGNTSWTDDYPKGDRKLVEMMRRYTRTNVRGVEQPVNLEDKGDAFYYPFIVVGLASAWQLTDQMAAELREYLLRGGFLYADSFFGSYSWVGFLEGLNRIFPDRPVVDLPEDHPVFHIVYDIPDPTNVQIPNMYALPRGYLDDGAVPHWRGIFDDEDRLMVLIGFNNDIPDSWQWANDPRYPADAANLGLRLGVNFAVYALTH